MEYFSFKKLISVGFILFALLTAFFYKIIFNIAWLWEDFATYFFPVKYYILNSLKNGTFSFWNSYIFSGAPIAADIQIGLFYPLNLLLITFSKPDIGYMFWLMEIQLIIHLFLGGFFMYLLMRYLKVSHFGALFSSIVFSLMPFFVVHLKHMNMIESVIWMPLIFLFFHKSINGDSLKNLIYASFFMGISILAGHPQINYMIFLFIFAYLVYNIAIEKSASFFPFHIKRAVIKKSAFFLFFLIISSGIAAVEILPYYEIFNSSDRNASGSFAFASSFSLHPVQFLITSFLPHFFGGQSDIMPYVGNWNYWELANYIGIIPLFLTIFGFIFLKNQGLIKFLFITALLSLFLSFGYYFLFYPAMYYFLPGLKLFRAPARFLFLYGFSLIIISGFVLDFVINRNNLEKIRLFLLENKKKCKTLICAATIFLLAAAGSGFAIPADSSGMIAGSSFLKKEFQINILKNIAAAIAFFPVAIFIFLNYLKQKISSKTFKIAVLTLAIMDIFWFGFEFNNGRTDPKNIFRKTPEIKYLEKNGSAEFRIINQSAIPQNASLIYGIRNINGYSGPSESQRYKNFLGEESSNRGFFSYPKLTSSPNRLELLNACYILSDELSPSQKEKHVKVDNLNLYQNINCLNSAFIAHQVTKENNPETILSLIDKKNFNPLKEIVLEKEIKIKMPDNREIYSDKAEITKYKPDYIEIKTDSMENGILFLSEIYYPGWEAYIDGVKTEIYRANYVFRAVELPKGNHTIKFTYNPKIFKTGFIISLISLASAIIGLLCLSRQERKKSLQ